jgi:glycosyltransferase involved in cell wall biosynthesis
MVPQPSLYQMTALNKFKIANYRFITHSQFTKKHLADLGIESLLLYPYLAQEFILAEPETFKKEKIILSVGRFFKHLHSKNQDKIISSFTKLKKNSETFRNYKLVLAGGLKQEDNLYFESLKKLTGDDQSIIFKPNVNFHELHELYKKSQFYWHFTGLGVDEKTHPEEVEHLGITPLEAMSMGCMTFCVNAGGPKEIVEDGKTGFLFQTEGELATKMNEIVDKRQNQAKIRRRAKDYILATFTFPKFQKSVQELIL